MRKEAFTALMAVMTLVSLMEVQGKAASDFAPDQSVVWVGFTLVIKGENLSSSDLVMVSNNSLRSNNSCSDAPYPQEIRGGSQRYLGQVSSDGKSATATFTLQEQSGCSALSCHSFSDCIQQSLHKSASNFILHRHGPSFPQSLSRSSGQMFHLSPLPRIPRQQILHWCTVIVC